MRPSPRSKAIVLLAVAIVFAGLLVAKSGIPTWPRAGISAPTDDNGVVPASAHSGSPDFAYESALADGKRVFLNFGLSYCPNCAEMSETVDRVMPDYADEVVYIKVMTDEPGGSQLAEGFPFQYVPTSYFIDADGDVLDSYTGKLDDAQIRSYLDALVASE